MSNSSFLLYGAYGYTGKLIAQTALEKGLKPILAGRNKAKLAEMSQELKLEYLAFDLSNQAALEAALEQVPMVLHAAGPFEHTAKAMVEACLKTQTHYVDITGEIKVFELMKHRYDARAKEKGIMLLPGAGFDIVPSDCLAAFLATELPDATHLELAFTNLGGGPSQGTALTAVENLHEKNLVREAGQLKQVPQGHAAKWIDFDGLRRHCVSIPWGDVSTAFYSTKVPNTIVYMGIPAKMRKWMRLSNYLRPLLKKQWVKNRMRKRIKKGPAGPSEQQRKEGKTLLWGQASNAEGKTISAFMKTSEGYTLTALTAVLISHKILQGDFKVGFQTPSLAYGQNLIMEIEGVERKLG